ncbi:Golgi-associated plant pathogenesis-related protein 1 [Orchesella cincta]|uniref:Golgi-associated plant pathogenesis-related protein 1 n=1 Tax=Orchesella cincta TaxID=48709 RepID=A0A1D2MMA5_ORCCI|nr:Golgi-associated plant pathogenesis-related protein 1 [Orchesella cincta]
MARLALAAFCIAALTATSSGMTFTEFGMDMASLAYESVCWYETLKQFPNTNSKGFNHCNTLSKQMKKQVMDQMDDEDEQKKYFGQFMTDMAMGSLPAVYASTCNGDLASGSADTSENESDVLNDQGQEYPFRAFAYCMMKTLQNQQGDEAIQAIKDEKTHARKHWMTIILDRDNEWRARHGAKPLTLNGDLNKAAQDWAETNARECNMYHSKNTDPIRQWMGEGTGESLSAGGGEDDNEDAAYQASNGWYEEMKDYPFPGGIQDANDPRFHAVGHFTQSVWLDTEYVGYGYAYNGNCSPYTHYIAARYFPAGNVAGGFQKNVVPPK